MTILFLPSEHFKIDGLSFFVPVLVNGEPIVCEVPFDVAEHVFGTTSDEATEKKFRYRIKLVRNVAESVIRAGRTPVTGKRLPTIVLRRDDPWDIAREC